MQIWRLEYCMFTSCRFNAKENIYLICSEAKWFRSFQSAPLLIKMWEVSSQYEKYENGWSEVSLHAKDCVPHYCVTRRSKTYLLYNSHLLFVFLYARTRWGLEKSAGNVKKGKKNLAKKKSIWLHCYSEGCIWYWDMVYLAFSIKKLPTISRNALTFSG